MIPIFVGFDQREAATYHVLTHSIIEKTTIPVSVTPLHGDMLEGFDGQQDGTNRFIYSRFLVPELMGFDGWALYMDSDMLVQSDLRGLWEQIDDSKAIMVVDHDYASSAPRKFIGTPLEADNLNYPKKNQSSLILWNCSHPANRILSKKLVAEAGGQFLHRWEWLNNDQIGYLDKEWNWLVGEYPENSGAKILHYTLGAPGFGYYADCNTSKPWHKTLVKANNMEGENAADMLKRAYGRQDTWRVHLGRHNELLDTEDRSIKLSGSL